MLQLEICLNEVRTNPFKYKPSYSCNYDSDIAPKLMTHGQRLPLKWNGNATTDMAARSNLLMSLVLMKFIT